MIKLDTENARFILVLNVMSQSDFLMKVNGELRQTQTDGQKTCTVAETHNTFTDFTNH